MAAARKLGSRTEPPQAEAAPLGSAASDFHRELQQFQAALFESQVNAQRKHDQATAEFLEAVHRARLASFQQVAEGWRSYQAEAGKAQAGSTQGEAGRAVEEAHGRWVKASQEADGALRKAHDEAHQARMAAFQDAVRHLCDGRERAYQDFVRRVQRRLSESSVDGLDPRTLRVIGEVLIAAAALSRGPQ